MIPSLDGVRALAFLAVFVHHLPRLPIIAGIQSRGWVGVHVFYALSAFLLCRSLLAEHDTHGDVSIRNYWARRVLRIWPLYIPYVLVAWALTDGQSLRVISLLTFTENIATSFFGYSRVRFAAHLWTISSEEQFYLLLALVFIALKGNRARLSVFAVLALCTNLLLRHLASNAGYPHPFIWTAPFSADAFSFGILAALWPIRGLARIPSVVIGATLISTPLFVDGIEVAGFHQTLIYSTVGMGSALIVGAVASLPPSGFLSSRPIAGIGRISFGLYVFHLPCISVARRILSSEGMGWMATSTLALALTLALASLSYRYLERPFLALKPSRPTPT